MRFKKSSTVLILLVVCLVVWIFSNIQQEEIEEEVEQEVIAQEAVQGAVIPPEQEEEQREDIRVERIRDYLEGRGSPLVGYSEEFVKASDEYEIDYRLVVAISVIESGAGKDNFRPYNAWGWGKKGFNGWTEGIWEVSRGLAQGYYAKGLVTPEQISKRYCPPNATNWARKVQGVMNEIGDI